jgi:hypothetical protein
MKKKNVLIIMVKIYILITWQVSYKRIELLALHWCMGSPSRIERLALHWCMGSPSRIELLALHWCMGSPSIFVGVSVAHLFSFLCCVSCLVCLVSCVPNAASFSGLSILDCPFTEFGTALTTVIPILFQYCYKYCYSDSRNL